MITILYGIIALTLFLGGMSVFISLPLSLGLPPLVCLASGLLGFSFLGTLIPCTLEEAGLFSMFYLRKYRLANAFLQGSYYLFRLPIWIACPFKSTAATGLARLALIENRLMAAEHWCTVARQMSDRESWTTAFRANVLSGEVALLQEDFNGARSFLLTAVDEFEKTAMVALLNNELSEGQARALDLLGQLALAANDSPAAEAFFERSSHIRHATLTLKVSAKSYQSYAKARIAHYNGRIEEAERNACEAADHLEENPLLVQHREVAIAILRLLWAVHTPAALGAFSRVTEAQLTKVHPLERELLTLRPLCGIAMD